MARTEHMALLKQGAKVWNAWRDGNPGVRSDLAGADLTEANLGKKVQKGTFSEATIRFAPI